MLRQIIKGLYAQKRYLHEDSLKDKIFAYIHGKVELPKLDYDYKDLEPIISEEIMRLHHLGHHQTYINKYIDVEKFINAEHSISAFENLMRKANFNGGGYLNHNIFFKSVVPPKNSHEPTGEFADMIIRDFGSYQNLLKNIKTIGDDFQGSGWIWLGYDMATGSLALATTDNQDILQMKTGLIPLLGIDIWEHAYYLQYKNKRAAYIENILTIMNWNHAQSIMLGKQDRAKAIKEKTY